MRPLFAHCVLRNFDAIELISLFVFHVFLGIQDVSKFVLASFRGFRAESHLDRRRVAGFSPEGPYSSPFGYLATSNAHHGQQANATTRNAQCFTSLGGCQRYAGGRAGGRAVGRVGGWMGEWWLLGGG